MRPGCDPRRARARGWTLALLAALLLPVVAHAADGLTKAPDWPNLLSEAGRRAAMALPASHPQHLEPTLADREDALWSQARAIDAKARYDHWVTVAGSPPNVQANNPAGDQTSTADTQSECAAAAFGNNVVVAWNDSKGLRLGAPTTVTSYATSCDGGATFTDGGNVPLLAAGQQSFGDCTLDVDNSGNFYLGVIYTTATQDAAVYRGTFVGCAFTWNLPVIAANGAAGSLDKPYLCVNPVDGNVYMAYTRFGATTNIEVVRGTALGTVWTAPVILDTTSGSQASRPYVGPEGNLYVCWAAGWGTINCDLSSTTGTIKFRRSTNPAGAFTFGPPVTAATVQHNWLSYWGGNVRSFAHYMPDMGVDRSGGVNNGAIYITYNEAATWGPPVASGLSTSELEVNDTPTAVNVRTINPGDNATGTISAVGDLDYWKINVVPGQHVMLRLEPQGFNCGVTGTSLNFQIRLFKGTNADSLLANSNLGSFVSEIVFDANEAATYLFRVRNAGNTTGTYTVKSRLLNYGAPNPARDMRDIVLVKSTNLGLSFGAKVLVNDDPANLDNELPALTVDRLGKVHVFYYDCRNANASRDLRSYYHNVSVNGGASWLPGQRISNELMYFNLNTVAVPNYGEYNQACTARGTLSNLVYSTWSDERISHASVPSSGVDCYVAALRNCITLSCAPDQTAASGTSVTVTLCVNNCGSYLDDFNYSVGDTQGWGVGSLGSLAVGAGGSNCINYTLNIPPSAVDGQTTVITFSATAATCPATTATCTTTITVQNPTSGLPPSGTDCFNSTAQVVVEIFNDPHSPYSLNLNGPTMVTRANPVPNPPGFKIDTEMVSLELTGSNPFLGPIRLHESAMLVSKGQILTPPTPFFPANSFFDVFFEVDLAGMTVYNRDRYRMSATINTIPPVGSVYTGADMLLYRKAPTGTATPVGRIISTQHFVGPPFTWFPPPGSDCLQSQIDMVVDIIGVGTDQLSGSGPMMVTRQAAVTPLDNRPEIAMEMVSMELTGNGPLVGPFRLLESPTLGSLGLNKSVGPGIPYPMDSFFDVFFEVELPALGRTAIPVSPVHMVSEINALPPIGSLYTNSAPVQLVDKFTNQPLGTLQLVRHTPQTPLVWAPPPDIDCFNSTASVQVEITGVGTGTVNLSGMTMIARGPAHDTGGGSLLIDTEMLSLELTGFSPTFGAMTVEEDIDKQSLGSIAGPSPGVMFPGDSFFDVFFVMTTPAGVLRNQTAVRMANPALPTVPPPPGTPYQGINNPVLLVDGRGNVRGRLLVEIHTTGPPITWTTDNPLDREEGTFYSIRGAYPNPFMSRTAVSFRLDHERMVDMRVYNVRGELVRNVHTGRLAAGLRTLEWDGKDQNGKAVGTGVYFYRLAIDGESVTRKVIRMQ